MVIMTINSGAINSLEYTHPHLSLDQSQMRIADEISGMMLELSIQGKKF